MSAFNFILLKDKPKLIPRDNETFLIPFYTPAKLIESDSSQKIPKKIFQTWKTRYVNRAIYNHINNLINENPEYDYYFFGDDECRAYLNTYFGKEYVIAFDELIAGAFKSDFWRYAILYREGGVYIDLDLKLLYSLRDLIKSDKEFISVKDRTSMSSPTAIYQAFIATIPKHPFMKNTFFDCYNNIRNYYIGTQGALGITGPVAMGNSISKLLNVSELKAGYNFGEYKNVELFEFVDNPNTDITIDNNKRIIIKGKIKGYEETSNYGELFKNGKIYHSYNPFFYYFKIIVIFFILFYFLFINKKCFITMPKMKK